MGLAVAAPSVEDDCFVGHCDSNTHFEFNQHRDSRKFDEGLSFNFRLSSHVQKWSDGLVRTVVAVARLAVRGASVTGLPLFAAEPLPASTRIYTFNQTGLKPDRGLHENINSQQRRQSESEK